jgi:hypothetical protein
MNRHTRQTMSPRRAVRPVTTLWSLAFTVLAVSVTVPASERAVPASDHFPALQDAPLRQYRALRRMHARNDKFNQEAWIEARTELDGQTFRYEITSERGSDYIRNKVLKALLTREQDLVAKGEACRAEISPENYQFEESEGEQEGVRYVLLKPKRKDMLLVNGRMILTPDGTELLRVEGTLAKNPSFWTSLVTVVKEFARVEGVRVPLSIATTAKLKMAGQAQLEVQYEYETINGRAVTAPER